MGRYKYHEFRNGKMELYDLQTDLGESDNLIDKLPDKAAEMRRILRAWRRGTGGSLAVFDNPE